MIPVLSAEQMRAAEQAAWREDPQADLMARAAGAVAQAADEFPGEVLVVVGPGNNGGDGLFAAARLAATRSVWLWCVFGRAHEAGLAAALEAGCHRIDEGQWRSMMPKLGLVIDALTGLGARAGLPSAVQACARAAEAAGVPVLSVDQPSGLVTDSGVAHDSFQATLTVTFQAPKLCHVLQPATSRCGEVRVVDIGVPITQTQLRQATDEDLASWYPLPSARDHKYTRGVVSLYTGSAQYPGAGLLTCAGALHVGVGMVRYLGGARETLILQRFPSVVLGEGRSQASVVGSGWSESERLPELDGPVVADADALDQLPAAPLTDWLLTPHAGELARLLGQAREDVEADPLGAVREAARRTGATVLLKGATQLVACPDGQVVAAVPGPAWSAQAGSGDVLAGMCGALLAAGLPGWQAATLAASLQALTAARHPGPYPPDQIAYWLPETISALLDLHSRL